MRFAVLAFLLTLVTGPALRAQVAPNVQMNPDQLAAYDAARLYIEGVETTRVSPGFQIPGSSLRPIPTVSRSRTWHPYRGDDRITEREFYTLVGREDLVARIRQREQTQVAGLVVGGLALAAGTGLILTSFGEEEVPDPSPTFPGGTNTEPTMNTTRLVFGTGLAVAGSIGFTIGLTVGNRRATHVQAAADLADRYNAALAASFNGPVPNEPTTDI